MEKIAGYNETSGQLQEIFVDYGILLLFAIAICAVALIISKTKNEQR